MSRHLLAWEGATLFQFRKDGIWNLSLQEGFLIFWRRNWSRMCTVTSLARRAREAVEGERGSAE